MDEQQEPFKTDNNHNHNAAVAFAFDAKQNELSTRVHALQEAVNVAIGVLSMPSSTLRSPELFPRPSEAVEIVLKIAKKFEVYLRDGDSE